MKALASPPDAVTPRQKPGTQRRLLPDATAVQEREAVSEPVSIVIPSWTGNVERTLRSIQCQTFRDYRVNVVRGVSPAGRARNIGVSRTQGQLILFIDDDAYFGHDRVLEGLVQTLQGDPTIGVVGPSLQLPPDANAFQRRLAVEAPRWVFPIHDGDFESNPPLDHYGHTAISTTCCLLRRTAFEDLAGFDESLPTGPEDTEFFYRMRKSGFRFVVPRRSWVYHYPPPNLTTAVKKYLGYGIGHALEARKAPERHLDIVPLGHWYGKVIVLFAVFLLVPSLFVNLYLNPIRQIRFGLRPLKAISSYAALCGYTWGWLHGGASSHSPRASQRK
ncbi:MAG: glycosyltransferase [Chloroflexota bacterium]